MTADTIQFEVTPSLINKIKYHYIYTILVLKVWKISNERKFIPFFVKHEKKIQNILEKINHKFILKSM